MFKPGQLFKIPSYLNEDGYDIYLLCRVSDRHACLIGVEDGNRYDEPVETKSWKVTKAELKKMGGPDVELIDSTIQVIKK